MQKPLLLLTLVLSSCLSNSTTDADPNKGAANIEAFPIVNDSLLESSRAKIQQYLREYADEEVFSGSVLVARDGVVLFKSAFGFADYERNIPNEVDTKYLIASTTKSFTAIALLKLEEKGLVDLHRPIAAYLPELKGELADDLTLDHLLRMTAGLPNHIKRLVSIEDRAISTAEMIQIINKSELAYKPGSRYSYSNLNYHLIAAIMEKVTGLTFAEVLKQELFDPLKMANSGSGGFDNLPPKCAFGYHVNMEPAEKNNLSYAIGSGSMYSTVEDIFRWDQALYDDRFLSKASKEKAFTGGTEDFGYYGYGFRVRAYERADSTLTPGVLVRHGGSMPGYLANVHRYLDDRITVIILGNISMFPLMEMTNDLKELALGRSIKTRD